jgi:transcriptional regulator with XRE-family HTH domain
VTSNASQRSSSGETQSQTSNTMNYAKAIRIARTLADLSQRELAQKLSLDPSLLSLLEAGKRKPSVATIDKITSQLGIPAYLFTLLASEEGDLKGASHETMHQLSTGLMRLLLKESEDGPTSRGSVQVDPGVKHPQSQRSSISARRKADKAR